MAALLVRLCQGSAQTLSHEPSSATEHLWERVTVTAQWGRRTTLGTRQGWERCAARCTIWRQCGGAVALFGWGPLMRARLYYTVCAKFSAIRWIVCIIDSCQSPSLFRTKLIVLEARCCTLCKIVFHCRVCKFAIHIAWPDP